jgi:hypothetical protein
LPNIAECLEIARQLETRIIPELAKRQVLDKLKTECSENLQAQIVFLNEKRPNLSPILQQACDALIEELKNGREAGDELL